MALHETSRRPRAAAEKQMACLVGQDEPQQRDLIYAAFRSDPLYTVVDQ